MNYAWQFLKLELKSIYRDAFAWSSPVLFYLIALSLFAFTLSHETSTITKIAPVLIWITALLSILMALSNLFIKDAQEGLIEQYLLSTNHVVQIILIKTLAFWITHCFPIILLTQITGLMLNLPENTIVTIMITLLFGTPILCLIGTMGAALVVGVKQNSLLLPLLIMPLYLPVLLLGLGMIMADANHQPLNGFYALLMALLIASVTIIPWCAAMALKLGADQ